MSSREPLPSWAPPESSYATPEAVRSAVNTYATRNGYKVTQEARVHDHKGLHRLIFSCDQRGTKRPRNSSCDLSKRRRCGDHMEIQAVRISLDGSEKWQLQHEGNANYGNYPPTSVQEMEIPNVSFAEDVRENDATTATMQNGAGEVGIITETQISASRHSTAPVGSTTSTPPNSTQLTAPSGFSEQNTWTLPCLPESSFDSSEAARTAVNAFASSHGYAVVKKSFIYDKKKKVRRVILACDRHGTKRAYTSTSSATRQRKKPSRRCGCPMEVNLVRILPTEGAPLRWEVQHRGTATTHNHPPSTGPSEHPTLRQHLLTDAIRRVIAADSQAGVPVSKTLARLALQAPTVVLVPNDVYNERRKLAETPLEGELPPPTEVPVYESPPLLLQSRIPLDLSGISVTPTTVGFSTETGTERPAPTRNPLPDPLLNSSTGQPRPAWMFPCYPEHFFESPGAARAAVNTFAARHGYAVVQKSCIYDKKKRIRRVVLGCDRHGTKRAYTSTSSAARQRKKPSRRCGCPMEVHLMRILPSEGGREQWQVQHRGTANEHNHPPSEGPSAHPILRRGSRTDAARQIIAADAAAGISVPQTLSRLAVEAPGVVMTRTDVLNERTKIEVRASEAE